MFPILCVIVDNKAIVWASMNEYKCIDVRPFGANIGAEIKGIDITSPLKKETIRATLFREYSTSLKPLVKYL